MPTRHVFTVNQERLFFIAAIMDGTPINVGRHLESQFRQCAARTAGELFFPSLITQLCRLVGITSTAPGQGTYLDGTITLPDIGRVMPLPDPVAVSPSAVPEHTTSESTAKSVPTTPYSTPGTGSTKLSSSSQST